MPKFLSLLALLLFLVSAKAQSIRLLSTGNKTSMRGLSVVTDRIVWASGSNGKVARSTDAGLHWEWITVPGFEKRDFRDIEAFSDQEAVIMAVDEPGVILRTEDGGRSWKTVFSDTSKGMFLDAMYFAPNGHAVVVGDPLPDRPNEIYTAFSYNKGKTWVHPMDAGKYLPAVASGESMFASSGTNLVLFPGKGTYTKFNFIVVTGGMASGLLQSSPQQRIPLALQQGKQSTGANSIAAFDKNNWIVVGGDFMNDKDSSLNCVLTRDGGRSFLRPNLPPMGYRSCVTYLSKNKLIACGTSGIDVSEDGGMHWKRISTESFHVVQKAKKGNAVFLAGNGRIAQLEW